MKSRLAKKKIQNKYNQQGMRGIFVGIPDDASRWAPEHVRYTTSYLQDKDEDTKPDN